MIQYQKRLQIVSMLSVMSELHFLSVLKFVLLTFVVQSMMSAFVEGQLLNLSLLLTTVPWLKDKLRINDQ